MKKEPAHTQALEVFVSSTEELLMALIPFFFSVDSAHHLSVPTLFIMVIELSGVQFGLKSFACFQN